MVWCAQEVLDAVRGIGLISWLALTRGKTSASAEYAAALRAVRRPLYLSLRRAVPRAKPAGAGGAAAQADWLRQITAGFVEGAWCGHLVENRKVCPAAQQRHDANAATVRCEPGRRGFQVSAVTGSPPWTFSAITCCPASARDHGETLAAVPTWVEGRLRKPHSRDELTWRGAASSPRRRKRTSLML